jgi:hypothetical protein
MDGSVEIRSLVAVNLGHASLDDYWEGIKLDERRL